MAGRSRAQSCPQRGGRGIGLARGPCEQLALVAQQLADAGGDCGERARLQLAGSARATLLLDQATQIRKMGLLALVHLAQTQDPLRSHRGRLGRLELDTIRERADQTFEHLVLTRQVFLEGAPRVLDHEVERARDADLAARDLVAVAGLDMIRNLSARGQHGRGRLEGDGAAHLARALRVLERSAHFGAAVDPVDQRDVGQAVVVASVVGHLDRTGRDQLQAFGRARDVDLGRLVAIDHDAMGALFAQRTAEKGL